MVIIRRTLSIDAWFNFVYLRVAGEDVLVHAPVAVLLRVGGVVDEHPLGSDHGPRRLAILASPADHYQAPRGLPCPPQARQVHLPVRLLLLVRRRRHPLPVEVPLALTVPLVGL
jgi:hypothetical protein